MNLWLPMGGFIHFFVSHYKYAFSFFVSVLAQKVLCDQTLFKG